jgi:hypothetical protein
MKLVRFLCLSVFVTYNQCSVLIHIQEEIMDNKFDYMGKVSF